MQNAMFGSSGAMTRLTGGRPLPGDPILWVNPLAHHPYVRAVTKALLKRQMAANAGAIPVLPGAEWNMPSPSRPRPKSNLEKQGEKARALATEREHAAQATAQARAEDEARINAELGDFDPWAHPRMPSYVKRKQQKDEQRKRDAEADASKAQDWAKETARLLEEYLRNSAWNVHPWAWQVANAPARRQETQERLRQEAEFARLHPQAAGDNAAAYIRGIGNNLFFSGLDEAAGIVGGAKSILTQWRSFNEGYAESQAWMQALEDDDEKYRGKYRRLGQLTGAVGTRRIPWKNAANFVHMDRLAMRPGVVGTIAQGGIKAGETVGKLRRGVQEITDLVASRPDILGTAMRGGGIAARMVLGALKSPDLRGRMLSAGLEGAGKGALYGFLNGKGGATDRLKSARQEAVSGSAIGAAVPFVVHKALQPAVDTAAKALLRKEKFWEEVLSPFAEVYVPDMFKPKPSAGGQTEKTSQKP